jgi:hypothetical protein
VSGHCNSCYLEPECGYPYKPCDCCNYRKFRPKDRQPVSAKVIQFKPRHEKQEVGK